MKRDSKSFRERFQRWKNGESYWAMRAEAEKRTADPHEQYDYVGYLNKYGTLDADDTETQHYTDEFKLPGHPTFSDKSIYSNEKTPGGHWIGDNVFEHSDWTMQHSDYTNQYLKEADPNAIATYKGGIVLPEIHVVDKRKNLAAPDQYQKIDSFIPSDNVRKHIAKWESSDFDDQNKKFGGDAVGAKGVEFHEIMKNYYKGFTQQDLDGMFSTFYNMSPYTYRRKMLPFVMEYNSKQDSESYQNIKNWMLNRYKLSKPEHKKGIKRRAKADVDLMHNRYDGGKDDNIQTSKQVYQTTQGNDVYYTLDPEGNGEKLSILNKLGNDPKYWTYVDAAGNTYTPKIDVANQEHVVSNQDKGILNQYINKFKYELQNGITSPEYIYPIAAGIAALPQLLGYGGSATGGLSDAASIADATRLTGNLYGDAIVKTLASGIGGEGVNLLSEGVTGKSYGQNIRTLSNNYIPEIIADFTNPGYMFGFGRESAEMLNGINNILSNRVNLLRKNIKNQIRRFNRDHDFKFRDSYENVLYENYDERLEKFLKNAKFVGDSNISQDGFVIKMRRDKSANENFLNNFKMLNDDALIDDIVIKQNLNQQQKNELIKYYEISPEYLDYINVTGENPFSQSTVNQFMKRQSRSTRGVNISLDNVERYKDQNVNIYDPEVQQYLQEIALDALQNNSKEAAGKRLGGDRLDTGGGLYTSNGYNMSHHYKNINNDRNVPNIGYVAILQDNLSPNPALPIEQQLRLRHMAASPTITIRHNVYSPLSHIRPVLSKHKRLKGAGNYIEDEYTTRSGGVFKNIYERAYLPGNQPEVVDLKSFINTVDEHDRWGNYGYPNHELDNTLFIPSRLAKGDFMMAARKYIQNYPKVKNMFIDLNHKADYMAKDRMNVKARLYKYDQLYSKLEEYKNKLNRNMLLGILPSAIIALPSYMIYDDLKRSGVVRKSIEKYPLYKYDILKLNGDSEYLSEDDIDKYIDQLYNSDK